jgi:hypothetical protein
VTDQIIPYETPQFYNKSGTVLKYRIDYKLLYFGGSAILRSATGLSAALTLMIAPVCWVDDFDEHLLRSKTAAISSSGRAGYVRLQAAYGLSRLVTLSAGFTYCAVTTRGPQKQTILSPEYRLIEGIPAETMAEWITFGAGLTLNFPQSTE